MPRNLFDHVPEEHSEYGEWEARQRRLRAVRGDDTADVLEDADDLYGRVA